MTRSKRHPLMERLLAQSPSELDTDLLVELLKRGQWRQCFKERSTTYAYAALLINFFAVDESSLADIELQDRSAVRDLIADTGWLRTQDLQARSGKEIAEAMFGMAICTLVLGANVGDDSVAKLSVEYKLPFRPCLVPDSPGSLPPCVGAFRAIVQTHLSAWLTSRTARSLEELAGWMGCAHTSWSNSSYVVPDTQPLPIYESVVIETLVALINDCDSDCIAFDYLGIALDDVIINGLLHNDRWQSCMGHIDFVYAFVALIMRRLSRRGLPPLSKLLHQSSSDRSETSMFAGAELLLSWTTGRPHGVFEGSSYDLADALFGEPWCSIVARHVDERHVAGLILSNRPAFQSCLLPAATQDAQQLPSLDYDN